MNAPGLFESSTDVLCAAFVSLIVVFHIVCAIACIRGRVPINSRWGLRLLPRFHSPENWRAVQRWNGWGLLGNYLLFICAAVSDYFLDRSGRLTLWLLAAWFLLHILVLIVVAAMAKMNGIFDSEKELAAQAERDLPTERKAPPVGQMMLFGCLIFSVAMAALFLLAFLVDAVLPHDFALRKVVMGFAALATMHLALLVAAWLAVKAFGRETLARFPDRDLFGNLTLMFYFRYYIRRGSVAPKSSIA